MVAIQKRSLPIRITLQKKELFIQTCGLLTLGLGNGTRYVHFSLHFMFTMIEGPYLILNSYMIRFLFHRLDQYFERFNKI